MLEHSYQQETHMVPGDRLLPMPALQEKVGFKHAKIYRLIRAGDFPPGRMLFGKRLWRESEIDAWIDQVWQAAEIDQEESAPEPEPPPPAPPTSPPPPAASPYWASGDLCERFGISRRTLNRWTQVKDFPAPALPGGYGSQSRWHADDVLEWECRLRQR